MCRYQCLRTCTSSIPLYYVSLVLHACILSLILRVMSTSIVLAGSGEEHKRLLGLNLTPSSLYHLLWCGANIKKNVPFPIRYPIIISFALCLNSFTNLLCEGKICTCEMKSPLPNISTLSATNSAYSLSYKFSTPKVTQCSSENFTTLVVLSNRSIKCFFFYRSTKRTH